jgi:hypothetical protein
MTPEYDDVSDYDQFAITTLSDVSEALRTANAGADLGYFDSFFVHGEWGLAANELVAAILKRKLNLDRANRMKLVRLYKSFRPEEPSSYRDNLRLKELLGV